MAQKPEIQYVDQFYIYGSAVPARKEEKAKRPEPKIQKPKVHRISIDLVALVGTVSAIVLLAALVMGGIRLNNLWQENNLMKDYVSHLQLKNATLQHNYRISYDLEEIKKEAEILGLVPESQVETRYIRVTIPEPKQEWTFLENVKWFFEGLFE